MGFSGPEAVFYGENRGGGEARMGGFAAKFRGFGLGEGAARRFSARRTVPGRLGEKFFKKGVENLKIGVREVPEGGAGVPYTGRAGRFSGLQAHL